MTRTDFLIQFVWQPPTAEKPAKPIEEIQKELVAAQSSETNKGAVAAADFSKVEQQLEQESVKKAIKAQDDVEKAAKAAAGAAGPAGNAPAAPGGAPAPGAAAPR